ncbi:MAG: ABC transporter ATP-binding protein [Nanoarchaeota archaeon]
MAQVIRLQNLSKSFRTKMKQPGILGSLQSVFHPQYREIAAVRDISFSLKQGELVAFIGPNGAGKSTTLKMLSGILFPDQGTISVLGFDPQRQRKQMAYRIGTIFGQKPQLWFHLPAIDSFELFSHIYDMERQEYKKRLERLVERFDIADIIHQPVRKLSLGQRMRCEFVLALLHGPDMLFLDEPTIGLDVVVKKRIRELIRKINKEEGVTVILTSHDMQDVEQICDRAIVINAGQIVYDGTIKDIRKKFIRSKRIRIQTDTRIRGTDGLAQELIQHRSAYSMVLEVGQQKVKSTVDMLLKGYDVNDITITEPPIEEIIEEMYRHA